MRSLRSFCAASRHEQRVIFHLSSMRRLPVSSSHNFPLLTYSLSYCEKLRVSKIFLFFLRSDGVDNTMFVYLHWVILFLWPALTSIRRVHTLFHNAGKENCCFSQLLPIPYTRSQPPLWTALFNFARQCTHVCQDLCLASCDKVV